MAGSSFAGKSMALGGGGRFAKGVASMTSKGMPMSEAKAIMAKQGRKKYGKKKMTSMAAAGRRRAARKRKGADAD
jgi:type II secretory pathway component PulF